MDRTPEVVHRGLGVAFALSLMLCSGCTLGGQRAGDTAPRSSFVRPLPGTAGYVQLLGKADAVSMRAGLVTLSPGKDCGWHSSEEYEEFILCLDGAGELRGESTAALPLAAGNYAYNPPHTRHCVFNTGPAVMRYFYVVAPAAAPEPDHHD
jgi:quercetin dioxygenase-like cupin family protein